MAIAGIVSVATPSEMVNPATFTALGPGLKSSSHSFAGSCPVVEATS